MKPITPSVIDVRFRSHTPSAAGHASMQRVRECAKALASLIIDSCPAGHEQEQAIAALETTTFWANSGIARAGQLVPVRADTPVGSIVSRPLRTIAAGLLSDLPVAYDELNALADLAETLEQELVLAQMAYEAARVLLTTKTE